MTAAPSCSDCWRVRRKGRRDQTCAIKRVARPLCADQRAPGGPCGPDAKLFAKRQGGGVMEPTYTVTLTGTDEARCGSIKISGGKGGPIGRLARAMEKQGLEPGLMDIRRDGTPVFARNMSVEWWASKSTSEPNAGSAKLVAYAPDPRFLEGR